MIIMRIKQPPPKPWIVPNPVAFVLGCDPTAFKAEDKGKPKEEREPVIFRTVFGLDNGLKYFGGINANLDALGLKYKTCTYIQNLVTDYQVEETSKNKEWDNTASGSIDARRTEFDTIDPTHKIPVLLTSERLYKVLMNAGEPLLPAQELYKQESVMIPADKNKLGQPLIALYRHPKYNYSRQIDYFNRVKNALNQL
ncbi:MAG TPA: hypothetical protein PLG29_11625 [Lentimicrobium sp.]|nr:hypothetical protein [Lentimicrobium sp.]